MKNEKREARNRKEDTVLNRVLVWFGAAVVVEMIMLLLNRYYINFTSTSEDINRAAVLSKILWPAALVFLVCAVLCALWYLSVRKKGGGKMLPLSLTLACTVLFVCLGVTYWIGANGVQFLCGAVPVAAVMALVYYLYQKEFFAVTVLSAVGILGLWIVRKVGWNSVRVYAYMAVAAVVLLLAALLFRMLQKNGGALVRGEKRIQIFAHDANYGMPYLTCGIVAVVLIAACALGTSVAYYLIFGLVAWLFVMAVYYTVKLM